tara:strand:+ start:48481 stop:48867 length:387 start_codon:yes stop_codon:yes gene_type:complete
MKKLRSDLTPPQFAALSMLDVHPQIDQATLAGLIACDRPTTGGIIDRLMTKGLIERKTNPKDRRAKVLTLTTEGVALLEALKPAVEASQSAILAGLNEAEQQEFIRLAAKVAKAGNELSRAPLQMNTD